MRKGKERKAPRYTSAAVLYDDYMTIRNIIPNTNNSFFVVAIYIQIPLMLVTQGDIT